MAVTGYSRLQIRLHWAVMGLVVLQYLLHDGIVESFEAKVETGAVTFTALTVAHIAGGTAILVLALWRLLLLRERGVPPPPPGDAAWQHLVARLTHAGIYALLLALPVTGVMAWGSAWEQAGDLHGLLRLLLLALVALHVAGALYGQFVTRSGIIRRMMTPE